MEKVVTYTDLSKQIFNVGELVYITFPQYSNRQYWNTCRFGIILTEASGLNISMYQIYDIENEQITGMDACFMGKVT